MKTIIELAKKFWELLDDPVVKGLAFALLGVPIYFALGLPKLTTADQQMISDSIQWFGVPYGFIIAFILVNVWTKYESTNRVFDQEADTVLTLYNTFLLSSDQQVMCKVKKGINEYVKLIIEYYSSPEATLRGEDEKKKQEKEEIRLLNQIRNSVKDLLKSRKDHDLAMELLHLINELVDDRGDRTYLIDRKTPASIRFLTLIVTGTWIVPFYALHFSSLLVGAFYIVAVTVVVLSILLIIIDLDEPIGGLWELQLSSWKDVQNEVA